MEPAEDIVAEAFIKAWDRRRDFQLAENLKAFLYRVVRNASINFATADRHHRQAHLQIGYSVMLSPKPFKAIALCQEELG